MRHDGLAHPLPSIRPPLRDVLQFIILCMLVVAAESLSPSAEPLAPAWLERVNFYRAAAALPPVVEEPALSTPVFLHARYMVMHDVVAHSEKARRSWATREGAEAAAMSNLVASLSASESDTWAVDTWMRAPFHAIGILDPTLRHVGFGIHRAQGGRIQTAAGLDVMHGRAPGVSASTVFPIVWPSNGATVPLAEGIQEYPNPLSSCKGYKAPTGLPLIVQLGSGEGVPRVTRSWISSGDEALQHCVFDESTYRNRNKMQQRLGRSILAARDAIVLIPRKPLKPGIQYRTILDVGGQRIDWTFTVTSPTTWAQ